MNKALTALTFFLTATCFASAEPIILKALDFDFVEPAEGEAPYYPDPRNGAIAIDASQYKDMFAKATTTFEGKSGHYNVQIVTMGENDGESTYKVWIGDTLIGTFQNPESDQGLERGPAFSAVFEHVSIEHGDTITVSSNSHTNGKIPEHDSTAYARGRWGHLSIELLHH